MKKLILGIALVTGLIRPSEAAVVTVAPVADGWQLQVDGKPFYVKGVGCNRATSEDGVDYLRMARDMGANAVRTWGITPRDFFDRAQKNGLMVDAGVWFNPIRGESADSYRDPTYCAAAKANALAHVHDLKDHPALLMWNLGNEVFAFTEAEEEKEAFGRFLEDLVQAVKKEDPNHPIAYACSGANDLPYLRRLVPSLDIVGVNTYGGYGNALARMAADGDKRPVIATEFGPLGAWDMKKDVSGLPFDPYDHIKAANYANLWKEIVATGGRSLGGFAFVLGDSRNQDSFTWWNVNYAGEKREAFWSLYTAYTGRAPKNHAPKIRLLKVSRVADLSPGEEIELQATASDPEGDGLKYAYLITDVDKDMLVVQRARFFDVTPVQIGPDRSHVRIPVPKEAGAFRVYVLVRDGHGNLAAASRGLRVDPAPAPEPSGDAPR